ncbi:MAG: tyrosine decarboxylase MfnA [Candidatus Bathyarchaeia archaeon]
MGESEIRVLRELSRRLRSEPSYRRGRILSSMCTLPHPLALKTYMQFIDRNIGDPGLFPETSEIEKDVIRTLGGWLANPDACGYIVSGGSEANLTALWVARNAAKKTNPEVILPKTAHFSFEKAADLLRIKPVYVDTDENFVVKVDEVERAISENTVAIVGIAGTTALGTIDPLPELSEIATRHGVSLHVDAAFGGFVIPFLKEMGYTLPDFDFRLPGVCSITVDPHKMGMAPIPAGGILFRGEELLKDFGVKTQYIMGGGARSRTLGGTRPGASVCAVWALLKYLGWSGYRRVVRRCMRLTQKISEEVMRIEGLGLVLPPTMNIVGIRSKSPDVGMLVRELREMGWAVSSMQDFMRIVVMPHLTERVVDMFIDALRSIVGRFAHEV